MASARAFLIILGMAFAVAGLIVSWAFDSILGIAVLLVGAFLLILPFMTVRTEE